MLEDRMASLNDEFEKIKKEGRDYAEVQRDIKSTEKELGDCKELEERLHFEETALAAATIRLELQQARARHLLKLQQLVTEANVEAAERKATEMSETSAAKDYLGEVLSMEGPQLDVLCMSVPGLTSIDVESQLRPMMAAVKAYGSFPPKKLALMVQRWPQMLLLDKSRVEAASEFLEGSAMMERRDAASLMEHQPHILGERLEKQVMPVMSKLCDSAGLDMAKVGAMFAGQPKMAEVKPDDVDAIIGIFNEVGIKRAALANLLVACPRLALLCPSSMLGPTIRFLTTEIGLSRSTLAKVVTTHPQLLTTSLELNLRKTHSWLLEMGVPQGKIERVVRTHPKALGYRVDGKLLDLATFMLDDLQLPKERAGAVIAKFPQILGLSVADNLRPTVTFLTGEVGISPSLIGKIACSFPQLLGLSVDATLRPHFTFLRDELGIPEEKLGKVVASFPHLLAYCVQTNLRPTLKYLHSEIGVPRKRLGKLVANHPQILGYSVDTKLKPTVVYLTEEVGVPTSRIPLLVERCPKLLGCSVSKNLRPTVSFFQEELRLDKSQIANIVTKYPALLGLSIEKNLRPKIEYLTEELGIPRRELEDLCGSCPQLLAYSLEKRIKPRHRLLEANGLKLGLHSMLAPSDLTFYARYGEGLATMAAVCPVQKENGNYYWHHCAALPRQPKAKPRKTRKPRAVKAKGDSAAVAAKEEVLSGSGGRAS